jgi:hypothetical protein
MKPDPLLEAIFSPGEDTLRPVLQAARRRRVRRVALRVAGTAACLTAAAWFLVSRTPTRSTPTAQPALASPTPRASAVFEIATTAMTPREIISSRPLAKSDRVRTQQDSVNTISTASTASTLPLITDTELFAFFEPGRVALVGDHPRQRLVEY